MMGFVLKLQVDEQLPHCCRVTLVEQLGTWCECEACHSEWQKNGLGEWYRT